jgi:hypothetical protein
VYEIARASLKNILRGLDSIDSWELSPIFLIIYNAT